MPFRYKFICFYVACAIKPKVVIIIFFFILAVANVVGSRGGKGNVMEKISKKTNKNVSQGKNDYDCV